VTLARGAALAAAFAVFATTAAGASCLAVVAARDAAPLAFVDAEAFTVSYVHSVTRTPVFERYRIERGAIVQTEMRFREHGPGLPTEADAGYAFRRTPDGFVVTMRRRFEAVTMRVHADQSPALAADGRTLDLAAWGNRAIVLRAAACDSH